MVEEIEEVRPELQRALFCAQRELCGNGKIVVGQAGAVVLVAPGRPNSSCGRVRAAKSVRDGVDGAAEVPIVEGGVRVPVVLMQRSCSDNVGPVISLIEPAEVVRAVEHGKWRAALYGRDARNLPIAEYLTVNAAIPSQQAMAPSHRQLHHAL